MLSWMKIVLLEVDAVPACFVDRSVTFALPMLSNEMCTNLCLSALLHALLKDASFADELLTSD